MLCHLRQDSWRSKHAWIGQHPKITIGQRMLAVVAMLCHLRQESCQRAWTCQRFCSEGKNRSSYQWLGTWRPPSTSRGALENLLEHESVDVVVVVVLLLLLLLFHFLLLSQPV